MVKVSTKQELARVYDVVKDILMNQPTDSEIKLVFEKKDIDVGFGKREIEEE